MKSPISQREIKAIVVKLHNEGITGNEFDSVFTQYILETCGIDYACPTTVYSPLPHIIKHRINEVDKAKHHSNLIYWKQRFWND